MENKGNNYKERIEFHGVTGISCKKSPKVTEYFSASKQLGQKAIGIADLMNVQWFMTSGNTKERENLKLLYGVEINCNEENKGFIALNEQHLLLATATYVSFELTINPFETENEQLLSLTGVKISQGKIIETFEKYIQPKSDLPAYFMNEKGLNKEKLAQGEPLKKVLEAFQTFTKDAIFLGFNLAKKIPVLKKAYETQGKIFNPPIIYTLELAYNLQPNVRQLDFQFLKETFMPNYLPEKETKIVKNVKNSFTEAKDNGDLFFHLYEEMKEKITYHDELNNLKQPEKNSAYNVLLYAKNKEGLENLYHLLSLGDTFYDHGIPQKEVKKYRKNLLVGSSFNQGKVSQYFLKDNFFTECSLGNFYDFLEVSPSEKTELIEKIVSLGEKENCPVIATGNFFQTENMLSTEEMLEKMHFLGEKKAREIVITNPNILADEIANFSPKNMPITLPQGKNASRKITYLTYEKAFELYGGPELPQVVKKRLDQELSQIIKYNFSQIYLILSELMKKLPQGEIVTTRGACASSFVGFLLGITQLNPLPTHYYCKKCGYTTFAKENLTQCPNCQNTLVKEGFNLPFASFSGLAGNKIPDFIFNVSHFSAKKIPEILKEILGENHVFSPSVKHASYELKKDTNHFLILAEDQKISTFTPIKKEFPLNMTEFSYDDLKNQLFSFSIYSHEDVTLLNDLSTMSGVRLDDIPTNDPKIFSLFTSPEVLKVSPEDIYFPVGTLGIPEFSQSFFVNVFQKVAPEKFSDLVKIAGLAHGKGSFSNNGEILLKEQNFSIPELISSPEDIMVYLMTFNLDFKTVFVISEKVRKGQWQSFKDKEQLISVMEKAGGPSSYLASLEKITYLFPKAHLIEYTKMSYNIAYFKVYYPIYFYAALMNRYFNDLDFNLILAGSEAVKEKIKKFLLKGKNMSVKEKKELDILIIVNEMLARGFSFSPVSEKSAQERFIVKGDTLLIPVRMMLH